MHAYLKRDVHQLADVFENFRSLAMNVYNLDPAHYYTLPGFTLDAGLKFTRAKLDLIQDQAMYEFIERGIRGGMTAINLHHCVANANDLEGVKYNPQKPREEMMYIDANNL